MTKVYDAIDLKILALLQKNTDGTAQDVGAAVGISTNACWRRMRAMQQDGTVMNRVALLHPGFLGVGLTVFARAEPVAPTPEWKAGLSKIAGQFAELAELHRVAGMSWYRLKLRVADLADYDRVCTLLVEQLGLRVSDAEFSVEEVKYTTQIPLPSPDA